MNQGQSVFYLLHSLACHTPTESTRDLSPAVASGQGRGRGQIPKAACGLAGGFCLIFRRGGWGAVLVTTSADSDSLGESGNSRSGGASTQMFLSHVSRSPSFPTRSLRWDSAGNLSSAALMMKSWAWVSFLCPQVWAMRVPFSVTKEGL